MKATITVTALPPIERDREFDPLWEPFPGRVTEEQSTITVDPPEALRQPGILDLKAQIAGAAAEMARVELPHGLAVTSVTLSFTLDVPGGGS